MGVSEDVKAAIKKIKLASSDPERWVYCIPDPNQIELLPSTILKAYRMARGEHEQI